MKPSEKAIEAAEKAYRDVWKRGTVKDALSVNSLEVAIEAAYKIDVDPEIERLKELNETLKDQLDGMMVNKGVFIALQEEVIAKEQRISELEAENARFRQEYDPRHDRYCLCCGCRRFKAVLEGEP